MPLAPRAAPGASGVQRLLLAAMTDLVAGALTPLADLADLAALADLLPPCGLAWGALALPRFRPLGHGDGDGEHAVRVGRRDARGVDPLARGELAQEGAAPPLAG